MSTAGTARLANVGADGRIMVTIAADKRPVIRRRKKPTIIRAERKRNDDDGGGGRWTKKEDELLRDAVKQVGAKNWKTISVDYLKGTRSDVQCLHRWQKVLRVSTRLSF